ncbi:RusA family crossover junction endodeoxyribonuclease [Bradyrhizobium sp. 197]|uniref:RusA family crossover junction endodeoxyribonuclease n=1 Tax=Bradyrhizobium sp. 197 TaxID=2782663 RepID=UPI001FF8F5A1|nr:RusA family crossover junction endodeoxyribonuclease [Bradyrhizobium sp. 197]MCK1479306.1 RusA family crossover junction endodeoxyribonuclease [Bradyrhizobium sp. 197]
MSTFVLPLPPSVNGLFANSRNGGRFRTQRYDSWIHEAGAEIMRQRPAKYVGPVILSYEVQEPAGKRKFDLGNREKALTDLLVSHGIIQADDNTIVREIKLKWASDVQGVRVNVASITAFPTQKDNAEAA